MSNKTTYISAIAIMAALLLAHILDISLLVLLAIGVICAMIILCDSQVSTRLLFFFSPLSYIFAFEQYNLFIFLAVAYIIKYLLKIRVKKTVFSSIILLAYCLVFADFSVGIKIGYLIFPILLCLIVFVCEETKRENYADIIQYFTVGFIASAIIGFFKEQIPSILELFGDDFLYIDGVETSMDIQRYSGLSYDPNFFALLDCLLIAIILFTSKKITLKSAIPLLFLVIVGFFTFSKSYILLLLFIGIMFVLKNSRHTVRNIIFIACLFVGLFIVENYTNIELLSLIGARFTSANGANDLTTGRIDLWVEYFEYLFENPLSLLFGDGFNALSLGKAVHNTYIDFIYRFGLIGTILWSAYFVICYKTVSAKCKTKATTLIPLLTCIVGFMFLSAFHFQQLWCCICIAYFATFVPKEVELCQN